MVTFWANSRSRAIRDGNKWWENQACPQSPGRPERCQTERDSRTIVPPQVWCDNWDGGLAPHLQLTYAQRSMEEAAEVHDEGANGVGYEVGA
jgi:hypothetical protein